MRIGFVHSSEFPSLEADVIQVVQACRAFAALGQQVTLFVPRAAAYMNDAAARADVSRLYGEEFAFEVVFVPFTTVLGRLKVLGSVRGTLDALRRRQLDLVYTRNPWTVAFLPRAGVPYVFEVHEERVHNRSPLLNSYLRNTIVRNSRKPSCAMMVAISAALSEIWASYGVPREKLAHAHDGVDLSLFDSAVSRDEARRRVGMTTERPLVVYAGSMKTDRGIDLMLQAARELPEMEFRLVGGKDDELARWRGMMTQMGLTNVQFAGRVPHRDIPLWLAAGDILLMMWTWQVPTIRGCSPMKMFEYMAAQRIIVGPAFPTVCEVLEDGKDAVLFEPDNLERMIEALRRAAKLHSDPTLPRAARRKAEAEYTWEARGRRILNELAERGYA